MATRRGAVRTERAEASRDRADASSKTYAAPALEKGLDVLEYLARQPEGLTKSQLARGLNRTISEIFRMLVCLEQRGYIAQLSEDRYALTLKLFRLVQEHPPTERLLLEALPAMHHVAHATLQSCHLGVLELGRVAILAQVNAPAGHGFFVRLGSTVDLMEAASGYVILAHQKAAQRERMLAEWRRETGKRPPPDLEAHLRSVRKAGYEKRASYEVKGIVNISFPVFDAEGSALGALTVPYIQYNRNGVPQAEVVRQLRRAAAEITTKLGGKLTQTPE